MSGAEKGSLQFTWIAPSAGTGPVTFRYAGVMVRTTYWANQVAGVATGKIFYICIIYKLYTSCQITIAKGICIIHITYLSILQNEYWYPQ